MHSTTRHESQQIFQFLQQLNSIVHLSEFSTKLLSILPLVIESDLTILLGTVYGEEDLADLRKRIDCCNCSDRDREMINFLWPHIVQAYNNSQLISQLQQNYEQSQQLLNKTSTLLIHQDGSIQMLTATAEKLIQKYFFLPSDDEPNEKINLPETIQHWLQQNITEKIADGSTMPLRVIQDRHTLVIRLLAAADAQYLLTLEEQAPLDLSFTLLRDLGLSKRESEILCWIFRDKSNQEISEILNLSTRTVQKHCEHIYSRLGVNSRAAAIIQILQQLGIVTFS